jgi:glycosyltransferase 2 family protein
MKKYKKIINCLKWGVFFTILYFVSRAITVQFIQIEWTKLKFDGLFFCLSIFFEILSRLFSGLLYTSLLKMLKMELPILISASISWVSQIGKYTPGKIAFLSSTIYFLNLYKIRPAISTFIPVLANIITVWVALIISLPLFFSLLEEQIAPFLYVTLTIIVASGIICLQPNILLKIGNLFLKRMGAPPIAIVSNFFKIIPSVGAVLLQCICVGISAWFLIRSITLIKADQLFNVIAIVSFAGSMGLLALFSPAGIGVREGIYMITFAPIIGSQKAALLAVVLRLIQTIIDVVVAIIGYFVIKKNQNK